MSKSKKERQQEKKNQIRENKKIAEEKNHVETVVAEKKEPESGKKQSSDSSETVDIKMNFYSAMAMIMTIVAAGAAVVAMIVAGRGFYYILDSMYKSEELDISLLGENLEEVGFHPEIRSFLYICGIVLAIQVLLSLVGTVTAINPKKKPNSALSVGMIALSVTAGVLYILAMERTGGIADEFARLSQIKNVNLYVMERYILIGNLVCTFVNLFGQMYGLKLYKKTGRTC